MRFLFFIVLFWAIDLYAFQAFKALIQDWDLRIKQVFMAAYWTIPVMTSVMLLTNSFSRNPDNLPLMYVSAFIFCAYIGKFIVLPFLFVTAEGFTSSSTRFFSQFR